VKQLLLCFPQASRSRKLRRDSCCHNLNGYGRALYARRKVIVEPVFGQIKEARGFRRFLLRGLDNIRGEWRLVCLTHNLLKLWRYAYAPITV
jgi:hypothetical protein